MRIIRLFLTVLFLIVATTASAAEKTPPEIAGYLKKQGPVIEYHIFRSGTPQEQIVVSYCIDENLKGGKNEGASNPANVHCEVALFNRKTKWVFANSVSIGQGSIREFSRSIVKGENITYEPEDPLCCPSKKNEIIFSTERDKLVVSPR